MLKNFSDRGSSRKGLVVGTLATLLVVGCSDPKKPNVELIQDMMISPAYKAQDEAEKNSGKPSMKKPPENTVPVGFKPYPYPMDPELAGKKLVNPLKGRLTPPVLSVGQKHYEIYCGVCHGDRGKGDGPVAEKMLRRPPSLVDEKMKGYSDGRIFHVISRGYGVMGAYANQMPVWRDRWAVVNYVRSLQKMSQ